MSERRRGLGRGLGALIPTAPARESRDGDGARRTPVDVFFPDPADSTAARGDGGDVPRETSVNGAGNGGAAEGPDVALLPVAGARFAEIPVDAISPNPRQPREAFDEQAMGELVESIAEVGLLQPVVVRALQDGRFELVVGERRWRATQQAGLTMIPVIVRDTHDDAMLRDALLENLHRVDLIHSRRPLPTSNCWMISAALTRSWRRGSRGHVHRSRIPCDCSNFRPPSNAGWQLASCPLGMLGRCSAWPTPRRRSGWPTASLPKG